MNDDVEDWEDEQEEYHKFLLFWDIFGLESAVNIDQIVQRRTEAVLKEEPLTDPDLNELISMMEMRARFNPDRQYELYAIGLPAYYTQDDVHDMFAQDAQAIVDLVRSRGIKLLGKRHRPVAVIK
jgi:hypothetical protein